MENVPLTTKEVVAGNFVSISLVEGVGENLLVFVF